MLPNGHARPKVIPFDWYTYGQGAASQGTKKETLWRSHYLEAGETKQLYPDKYLIYASSDIFRGLRCQLNCQQLVVLTQNSQAGKLRQLMSWQPVCQCLPRLCNRSLSVGVFVYHLLCHPHQFYVVIPL